ncbi:DWNN-domain-containing protein, partial [Jaminaea rosea]
MSSVVHYKFKSQRDASRVVFDGTALSVYDLKREIMVQNKMGKGVDFDIALYNAQTEEEYRDDNHLIPRSSTVLVRRLPPQRPGRGTAQMYVADLYGGDAGEGSSSRFGPAASGMAQGRDRQQQQPGGPSSYRGPMSVRFDDRGKEPSATPAPPPVLPPSMTQQGAAGESNGGDEAASIAAMFQATTDQWDATQQQMANATYRSRGGGPPRGGGRGGSFQARSDRGDHHQYSDRPPPVGYICYRCGKKGHWIQECPTNLDPNWDDKPRFKRTTGIPKSMLKTVENPTETQRQAGIMVTSDGTYVVAQVDSATWEAERSAALKTLSRSDVFAAVPTDSALACPLCSKLLKKAVKTPCCTTRFCEECIQNHLLENDFKCAECDKRIADLGDLARDDEVRRKVEEYVEEAIRRSEE